MKEIVRELTSAQWWVTVAIASLFFNVLASYLVRGLDRILPRLYTRMSLWSGRKSAEFLKDMNRAANNIQISTYLAARQSSLHIAAIQNYAIGFAFFHLAGKLSSTGWLSEVVWAIGILFTMVGAGDFGRAMRCKTILDGAERIRPEPTQQNNQRIAVVETKTPQAKEPS